MGPAQQLTCTTPETGTPRLCVRQQCCETERRRCLPQRRPTAQARTYCCSSSLKPYYFLNSDNERDLLDLSNGGFTPSGRCPTGGWTLVSAPNHDRCRSKPRGQTTSALRTADWFREFCAGLIPLQVYWVLGCAACLCALILVNCICDSRLWGHCPGCRSYGFKAL